MAEYINPASQNKWYQYQALSPAHTTPEILNNIDVIDAYYGSGFTKELVSKVLDRKIGGQELQRLMTQAGIDTYLSNNGHLTIMKKTVTKNNNSNTYKTGSVKPSSATTSKFGEGSKGKASVPFYVNKRDVQSDGTILVKEDTITNKPRMYKNGVELLEKEKPPVLKTKISPSIGLAGSIANIGTNILTGYEIVNFLTKGTAENKLRDLVPDEWESLIFGDGTIDATMAMYLEATEGTDEKEAIQNRINSIKLFIDERFFSYSGLFASKNGLSGIQDYTNKDDNSLISNATSLNRWNVSVNENISVFSFTYINKSGSLTQITFTMDKPVNVAAIKGIYNDNEAVMVVIASTEAFSLKRIIGGTETVFNIDSPAHADNENLTNYGFTQVITTGLNGYFTKENVTTSVFNSNRNYNADVFPSDILGDVDISIWTNIRDYLRWMVARKQLRKGNKKNKAYYILPKNELLKGGFTKQYPVSIQEADIPFSMVDNVTFTVSTNIGTITYTYKFDTIIAACISYCTDDNNLPFFYFMPISNERFTGKVYHGEYVGNITANRYLYVNKDLTKFFCYGTSIAISVSTIMLDYPTISEIYSIKCDAPVYDTGFKGSDLEFFEHSFGKYTLDNFACYSLYNNTWYEANKIAWDYIAYLIAYLIGTTINEKPVGFKGNMPNIDENGTIDETLQALKDKYPDLWNNRIEEDFLQDDGTITTKIKLPISLPTGGEGDNPTTEKTNQYEQEYQPKNVTEPDEEEQTKQNTINGWLREPDPNPNPDPEPYPDTSGSGVKSDYTPPNENPDPPPPSGDGDTPSVIIPVGAAEALWSVYNPTLAQVKQLGSWLWSSTFADQILKILADPMQAIISCHKIFGIPSIDGTGNIKVGYLDSGISDVNIVNNQYTHVDCGEVNIQEYFGCVFDYAPYTDIQIYLPFIGIVPLRVEDVLRSTLSVSYDIDVLTGTCLANVNVLRDNAGGVLYTYNGNCAVQYPLSSGSYLGVVSTLLSIAGGFAVGGAAGGIVGGALSVMNSKGTDIKRSGNLSGNAGAMGIKKPYVIISRPITAMANDYQKYIGIPTNSTAKLSDCKGFVKCKEVFISSGAYSLHLKQNPTVEQANEIESLLKQGVIIN